MKSVNSQTGAFAHMAALAGSAARVRGLRGTMLWGATIALFSENIFLLFLCCMAVRESGGVFYLESDVKAGSGSELKSALAV